MLVFGGIGAQMIFGDVSSLRVADPLTFYAAGSSSYTLNTLDDDGSVGGGDVLKRRRRRVMWEEVALGGGEAPEPR
jgi:hypothetical protein